MVFAILETGRQILAVIAWLFAAGIAVWGFFKRVASARDLVRRKWQAAVGGAVRSELNYRNDGESMRDQLDRMELHQSEIRKELVRIDERIDVAEHASGQRASSVQRVHERIDHVLEVIATRD